MPTAYSDVVIPVSDPAWLGLRRQATIRFLIFTSFMELPFPSPGVPCAPATDRPARHQVRQTGATAPGQALGLWMAQSGPDRLCTAPRGALVVESGKRRVGRVDLLSSGQDRNPHLL